MANAGRVAIVPKGDYSSSTAYNRLDLVRYNEKAYVAKKSNTGILPTNTEYWMLMTSDGIAIDTALSDTSTNPVQNKVIKTALDNIQTTSKATLSTAGWYRVAEYSGDEYTLKGSTGNGCLISLKGWYSNSGNYDLLLKLTSVMNTQRFEVISSNSFISTLALSKIRYAIDATNKKAYIEVYYNVNIANGLQIALLNQTDYRNCWKAIELVATSETVDGVTVTTTYDIPANASPVTDLDLANYLPKSGGTITADYQPCITFTATGAPNTYGKVQKYGDGMRIGLYNTDGSASNEVVLGNNIQDEKTLLRMLLNDSSFRVVLHSGNYGDYALPKSGGEVNGNLSVKKNSAESTISYVENNIRSVYQEIEASGKYNLYDKTNDKPIIESSVDCTTTFNGTATGNLPLSGGQVGEGAWSDSPLEVYGQFGTTKRSMIKYSYTGTLLGYMGFDYDGNPIIIHKSAGQKNLHHDGNSAKVAIQESAPTDTTSLWVDTANKVTKAYIDGAWTQVA